MPEQEYVFTFTMADLETVYRRDSEQEQRQKRRARGDLALRFAKWGVDPRNQVCFSKADLQAIIQTPDGAEVLVRWAERLGPIFSALRLTSSQLRNVFAAVRQIEMSWPMPQKKAPPEASPAPLTSEERQAQQQLVLLRPKLAYQTRRNQRIAGLADVLTAAIALVRDRHDFRRFVDLLEAILAYHATAEPS